MSHYKTVQYDKRGQATEKCDKSSVDFLYWIADMLTKPLQLQ